ncbi:MAG: hypothetical protein NPINA01_19400 [Nitrospinaceae bacterium]|nr:MAG: hypothetical protein NPINA01_19400 [Nitrospinaceae bacterium]
MRFAQNKILVVEDESIVAAHIAESLKHSGYKVTDTVSYGEQAVESVMQNRPDLVLMDVVLVGPMDGIEAGEVIYSNFDIPIIFLTAYSDKKTLARAKKIGPFGYLVKPFKETDLHSGIQMALEKHRQEKGLKERERWLSSSLQNLAEPVIATDKKARVTFFNRAAQSLTGLEERIVLGVPVNEILGWSKNAETDENPFVTVLKTGKSRFFCDALIKGKGGLERVNVRVTQVLDDMGLTLGTVGVFKKIEASIPLEGEEKAVKAESGDLEIAQGAKNTLRLCPWCEKILNEKNNQWEPAEAFLAEHNPEVEVSHCVCKECAKSLGLFDPEKISENDDMLI